MERLFSPCTRFYDVIEIQGLLAESRGRPRISAHPDCFALTIVRLFSSCTGLRGQLESQGFFEWLGGNPEHLWELNLDVSTEELLSAERAFTYVDLYALLANKDTAAWLTPHAAVVRKGARQAHTWGPLVEDFCFCFSVDGKEINALAASSEHLSEVCDVVLKLLAVSAVRSVSLHKSRYEDVSINASTLACLIEQCHSLKLLSLNDFDMDEDHCRVLGTFSRPDLEIDLIRCTFTHPGTTSALAEVLGRNQGPTKLHLCYINNLVLADGLRGNSRLKSLRFRFSDSNDVRNQELLAIAGALRENKGLVALDLSFFNLRVSDETWHAVCDSLKTHPTLEILNLSVHFVNTTTARALPTSSWMSALANMLKVNTSIHTIHLESRYRQHELFHESVFPYLDTNRLRPRVTAIQKTLPSAYRAKVLGRALLSARTDPNRFWILLSGNVDIVAFQLTTATTTLAANLPIITSAPVVAVTSNAASAATVTRAASTNSRW
jgi:hypothetical protein